MHALVNDEKLWNGVLAGLPGFEDKAAAALEAIEQNGTYALMENCLQ